MRQPPRNRFVFAWKAYACETVVGGCGAIAGSPCKRPYSSEQNPCDVRKAQVPSPRRLWFVSPYPLRPIYRVDTAPIRVRYDEIFYPIRDFRGGVPTARDAAEVARVWRQEGRRSALYLALVADHVVKHCMKYRG